MKRSGVKRYHSCSATLIDGTQCLAPAVPGTNRCVDHIRDDGPEELAIGVLVRLLRRKKLQAAVESAARNHNLDTLLVYVNYMIDRYMEYHLSQPPIDDEDWSRTTMAIRRLVDVITTIHKTRAQLWPGRDDVSRASFSIPGLGDLIYHPAPISATHDLPADSDDSTTDE